MPSKLTFTIDDSELRGTPIPIVVDRARAALGKLPDGKLLTRRAVASLLKVSEGHVANCLAHPAMQDYRELHVRKMLYANPETIQQFRLQKSKS